MKLQPDTLKLDNTAAFKPIYDKEEISCPRCFSGIVKKEEGKYYGFCDTCPNRTTYVSFFTPMLHQLIVADSNTYETVSIGAMGTGKTDGGCYAVAQHLLEIPGAYVLMIANDIETAKDNRDQSLSKFIPDEFFAKENGKPKKNARTWELKNKSKIKIIDASDAQKFRGRSVTLIYGVETNKISYRVIQELKARLRNDRQKVFQYDDEGNRVFEIDENGNQRIKTVREFGRIIMESNPDIGSWIYDKGLLQSSVICYTSSVRGVENYEKIKTKKSDVMISVISSTDDNIFATERQLKGTETWDDFTLRQQRYGEFVVDGSPVWPDLYKQEVKAIPRKNKYPHFLAMDWGTTTDPIIIIKAFLDIDKGQVVVYEVEEIYKQSTQKVGARLLEIFAESNFVVKVADPSIWNKKQDFWIDGGKSTGTELEQMGVYLSKGQHDITSGERAVNNLILADKIKFDVTGKGVLEAFEKLKLVAYPKYDDNTKRGSDKTKARIVSDNHVYDTIRYLAMELPELVIESTLKDYFWKNFRPEFKLPTGSFANHAINEEEYTPEKPISRGNVFGLSLKLLDDDD